MADGYISQITLPDNSTYLLKDSNALPLSGGSLSGGLEIKGQIKGDNSGTTGHGLYSGGGYHRDYNNIILHGDASTGTSGIAFVSDKVASNGTITNINAPSDRAFIQYHANGITTTTVEGTAPTLATAGEEGRLVIGIGNDSGDKILLQAPGNTDILHQKGATGYPIPHTINTNGSVGGTTTPVYVEAGEIKAGTALGGAAYKAVDYYAIASHTHTTAQITRPAQLHGLNDVTLQSLVSSVRANRLAFLPASQIIIENTTDGGATWTDAGITDTAKTGLFSEQRPSINIPKINNEKNINCGVRITFTAMRYNVPEGTAETQKYNYWNADYILSAERYCQLKEFYFWVNASNDGIQIKVERATGANPNNWSKIFENTDWAATGWSGNDYIRFSQSTFGGSINQTGNYWNYRITCFTRNNAGGTTLATSSTTSGQAISEIRGYGDTWWTQPNNYMAEDHLYRFDSNQNAIFPANITATKFIGDVQGNITGTAANVTGVVAIANGGTGKTSASEAWTALGGGASGKHPDNYFVMMHGNAGKSNMNDIGKMWPSAGMTSLTSTGNADTPKNGTTYTSSWHLYWDTSYSDDPSSSNAWVAQIVNKAGTSQWWVRSRAGGTITNGVAWASSWRHIVTSTEAAVGDSNTPIYINENGEAVAGTALGDLAYEDSLTYSDVGAAPESHGNHIPTGGSSGQFLGWSSSGTAAWINNPNTDTKVTQTINTVTTGADNYPLLLSYYKTTQSDTTAQTVQRDEDIYAQPSTGILAATKYLIQNKVRLEYDSNDLSLNFVFI